MENQIKVGAKNYALFLRCLSIVKDHCNDVDIRGGFIRQRTNDSATMVEVDLTPIIGKVNLPISLLKEKLNIWKCFSGRDVNISTSNDFYSFSDDLSTLETKNPKLEYLDNKFITEQELRTVLAVNQGNLILSTDISERACKRIKNVTRLFYIRSLQVEINNDNASLSASTSSKENYIKFLSGIPINRRLNHVADLIITPFTVEHDGKMKFEMSAHATENNMVVNKFSMALGCVRINLYSRTVLKEIVAVETPTGTKLTQKKKSSGKKRSKI